MKEDSQIINAKKVFVENIAKNFDDISRLVKDETKDPNNFIDINTLESYLNVFLKKNINNSLDAVSEIINSIDEKELITKKKRVQKIRC